MTDRDNLVDVLTAIYQRRGRLIDEDVLAESADPAAPLHHRFEWDDTVAGHQHRLSQARQLIRSAKIRFVGPDSQEAQEVRAFVSVRQNVDPAGFGYKPTEEVMTDPVAAAVLLRECERAIAELKRKYSHLKEFRSLIQRGFAEDLAG